MLQAEDVAEWLGRWGIAAYLLSILLNVVISIVGVIPSVFLTAANVLVFGWIQGFFVSWIGEVAGAAASYMLYRQAGFKLEQKYLSKQKKAWFGRMQGSPLRQFLTVLIARVIPFMPSALVTVMSVISEVRISIYLLATGIGKAPSIFLESIAGYGFKMIEDQRVKIVITVLLLISFFFVLFTPGKSKLMDSDT